MARIKLNRTAKVKVAVGVALIVLIYISVIAFPLFTDGFKALIRDGLSSDGPADTGAWQPVKTTTFSADEAATLSAIELDWSVGEIEVACGTGDTITIREEAREGEFGERDGEVEPSAVTLDGGTLKLRHEARYSMRNGPFGLGFTEGYYNRRVVIELPEAAAGVLESIAVSSISGDTHLANISTGALRFTSTSGSLIAEDVTVAGAEIVTVSGDVTLTGALSGTIMASSTSGDVDLGCVDALPECVDVENISGDARLRATADASFDLTVSTVSGDLESDLALEKVGSVDETRTYRCGAGGAQVNMSTVSGDIEITPL